MLKNKTIRYLNDHCHALTGKTVVVTGANSGIGFKATEELLFLGAKVIMACRNAARAEAARERLLKDYPAADIEVRLLDVASRDSIAAFAASLVADGVDVDAVVNNAGIFHIHGTTDEGEDIVMGTNYTGTRRLAETLLPWLQGLGHAVTMTFTTSISVRIGVTDDTADIAAMGDLRRYATSKRRLTRYALALADAEQGSGSAVRVVLTHPGIAITAIGYKAFGERFMRVMSPLGRLLFQSPEKSALSIPLVLTNDVAPGSIYGPKGFMHGWGYPSAHRLRVM